MKTFISGLLIGGCVLGFSIEKETAGFLKNDVSGARKTNSLLTTDNLRQTSKTDMAFVFGRSTKQNMFSTRNGHISFFSKAPVSDVDAQNERVAITLDASTGELKVNIAMSDFEFRNKKMGRDARKKYIEIDEFPQASFVGKISGGVDYDKAGSYPVTATGKLKIHGVEREISEKGTIKVEKGRIKIDSKFNVALKDHNIETPRILGQEMTEDKVIVNVEATLSAASK